MARGDFQKTFDIDIEIEANKNVLPIKDIFDDEVDTFLKFDVVDLSAASEKLREGIIIYEKEN